MTRLVRKVKLVMAMGNVYVNMVTKDKSAVSINEFTSKGLIIFSLHAQVSLLCSDFFDFIAIIAKCIAQIIRNLFGNSEELFLELCL